ncbi:methyl-accepting chemotaxis protein [Haloplanus ruber]|uniref:Methyl-accepting chemotaxis protein n=1 Tax=Haloplanus ruber TaxID=869892 RepID=A0ABD6D399_9EURY|nr:methyl-accepting chemotaxis protein [Haloplanus ruber]
MRGVPSVVTDSYLKRFATIVAVVLIVVAGVGVFFQGQAAAEIRHNEQAELRTIAELEANAMNEWIDRNGENARLVSALNSIESGDRYRIDAALNEELEQLPDSTHSIHYVDIGPNRIIESTHDDQIDGSLEDLRWTRSSLDGLSGQEASAVAVSEGYQQGGVELIAFATRIEGTDRAIVLTVDASQRAADFRTPTESSFTQVVDSEGVVTFAADEEAALESYGYGYGHVNMAQQGETGVMDMPERDLVVGYAPVEGSDWVVVTHTPRSEAYALVGTITRDIVALVGIALAGFLLIGVTLGRNTVNALNRLTDDAEAIAGGDLDVEVASTDRDDEVGRLVDAFADMQSYLSTAAGQAEAVADQRFDAAVLDEDVPGAFGETIEQMSADVERAQREAKEAQRDVEELNTALETQADEFGETMSQAAAGDLTQRMDAGGRSEAMNSIAESFNGMMAEMEATLGRIREFADEVATASQEVTTGTEEVESASEDVADSIQEISAGAERQDERLTTVSGEMQSLSGAIEEVASSADEVATTAERTAETSEAGSDAAMDAVDELERIEARAEEAATEVTSLAEEVTEIGDIVDDVAAIAEQTNMLALNASIEAAHADSDGDGFAVVADEIKSLAGDAADATERIDRRIAEVQDAADGTVDDMRTMRERVADGSETIDDALTSLDDIARQVDDLHTGVREISEATDDQAASTEDVVSMLDEVSELADRSSAEAGNVSAAAEEQTSTLSDVSEGAQSLSERAESLRELLAAFTVESEHGAAAAGEAGSPSAAADGGTER